MGRPRKLWSLDPKESRWMGRDHENPDARGQAARFVIAKLHETQGRRSKRCP